MPPISKFIDMKTTQYLASLTDPKSVRAAKKKRLVQRGDGHPAPNTQSHAEPERPWRRGEARDPVCARWRESPDALGANADSSRGRGIGRGHNTRSGYGIHDRRRRGIRRRREPSRHPSHRGLHTRSGRGIHDRRRCAGIGSIRRPSHHPSHRGAFGVNGAALLENRVARDGGLVLAGGL